MLNIMYTCRSKQLITRELVINDHCLNKRIFHLSSKYDNSNDNDNNNINLQENPNNLSAGKCCNICIA